VLEFITYKKMDLRKITSSFGIVLTLLGGGYAAEYNLNSDIEILGRSYTQAEYDAEKSVIMARYENKSSDLFFWTNDGKAVLTVMAIELRECIKRDLTVSDLSINSDHSSLLDSLHELITNECL